MMGPFQISDAPFQGYICDFGCWFLTSSVNKGTWSSESVLLDIHVAVICGNMCFTHCLHILFLNVFIDSPLESVPVRFPVRWLSLPAAVVWWSFFETSCNKLLSLLTSVSIDSPCELALFWLPVCWLQLRTVKLLPGEVIHRYQPGKIMKDILAML